MAVGSTGGILKHSQKHFLGGAVNSVFMAGVSGTSSSAGDASGMMKEAV